jgi:tRNA (guanine-N7-)-methyltransferase
MSRRNKLKKFSEVLSFPNVYENPDATNPGLIGENGVFFDLKGNWNENHFKNKNQLTLELACGKGDYTVELARQYPGVNFIGIDIKGARIWRGAKTALEQKILNAAFLRTRIEQINLFFDTGEVDEIWITFPDPFLKNGKENRRLTSPFFLGKFKEILKPGGILHLKTDDDTLYEYTLKTLHKNCDYKILWQGDDIYAGELAFPELNIKTFYEKGHLSKGKTIKYVRFQLV